MNQGSRHLDAAISRELFDYTVQDLPHGEFSLGPPLYYDDPDLGFRMLHNPVPRYSSDDSLSGVILKRLGYDKFYAHEPNEGTWEVGFDTTQPPFRFIRGKLPNPSLTYLLCLAALRLVRQKYLYKTS